MQIQQCCTQKISCHFRGPPHYNWLASYHQWPPGSSRSQVSSQGGDLTQQPSLAFVESLLLQSLPLTSATILVTRKYNLKLLDLS